MGPAGVGITAAEKAALAPLASPTFTGTATIPTANITTLNVSSTATLDGNVNLGNSQTDLITITGHLNFTGSAPTFSVAGGALGSTGTCVVEFANDSRGCIKVTPGGTGISSGQIVGVTFAVVRDDNNYAIMLTAADGDAAGITLWTNQSAQTTSGFSIRTNTVLTTGVEYRISYWIVE